MATTQPLSSRVPRPHTAPSWISAENGGCCQGAPSSTGTTSRWAISTTGRSSLAPAQRNSRPCVPTRVSSRAAYRRGKSRACSARNVSKTAVSTAVQSRSETVGMRTSVCSFSTAGCVTGLRLRGFPGGSGRPSVRHAQAPARRCRPRSARSGSLGAVVRRRGALDRRSDRLDQPGRRRPGVAGHRQRRRHGPATPDPRGKGEYHLDAQFSPNGKWIAYEAGDDDGFEVRLVRPEREARTTGCRWGARTRVSASGLRRGSRTSGCSSRR